MDTCYTVTEYTNPKAKFRRQLIVAAMSTRTFHDKVTARGEMERWTNNILPVINELADLEFKECD